MKNGKFDFICDFMINNFLCCVVNKVNSHLRKCKIRSKIVKNNKLSIFNFLKNI